MKFLIDVEFQSKLFTPSQCPPLSNKKKDIIRQIWGIVHTGEEVYFQGF